MVVTRSLSAAWPHCWQLVNAALVVGSISIVAVHEHRPRRSVTSFQCRWSAIFSSAGNQLPAPESPTRATVSTGFLVSPNGQAFSVAARGTSRQPSCQYCGRSDAASWSGGRTGSDATLAAAFEASAAAPG